MDIQKSKTICGARITLLLAFSVLMQYALLAQPWKQIYPRYESDEYRGVAFAGRDTVYIAGLNFFLQRSVDRGEHWETVYHTLGAMDVWNCGYDGKKFWMFPGGCKYFDALEQDSTHAFLFYFDPVKGDTVRVTIPMPNANKSGCYYTVGRSSLFIVQAFDKVRRLWRSVDEGASWSATMLPDSIYLRAFTFLDSLHGFFAYGSKYDGTYLTLYSTRDGGKTLKKHEDIRFDSRHIDFSIELPMAWIDDSTAVAVPADNIPRISHDAGVTWTSTNAVVPALITSIRISPSGVGYVVGWNNEVLRTTDFGYNWIMLRDQSTDAHSSSIAISGDSSAVFMTKDGDRLVTNDGGLTWSDEQVNPLSHVYFEQFLTADDGFIEAMHTDGSFEYGRSRTFDGGRSWIPFVCPNKQMDFFIHSSVHVTYAIPGSHFPVDTIIMKTTDDGQSWTGCLLDTLAGFSDKRCFGMNEMSRGDDTVFFAFRANGTLLWTTNGGDTWRFHSIPKFNAMNMRYHSYSWAITDSIVMRSGDDGLTWDPILTLPQGGTGFRKLVVFSGRSVAVMVARDDLPPRDVTGFLLRTTDGGSNWSSSPIRYVSLSSYSFETPFLTEDGCGIEYSGVSSPSTGGKMVALAVTTDFWQTYSKRTILSSSSTFQDAFFLNRNDLFIAINGRIYSTTTGGIDAVDPTPQPSSHELASNYPNPFSTITTVPFRIDGTARLHALLELYDIMGRRVRTLFDGTAEPGAHVVSLSAGDLKPGVHFVRFTSGGRTEVRKVMVVR